MSKKHTAGPWEVGHSNAILAFSEGKAFRVAQATSQFVEAAEQDARLIASAPDLLWAAKEALGFAESWIHDQLDGTLSLESALAELEPVRQAIAKAEGTRL